MAYKVEVLLAQYAYWACATLGPLPRNEAITWAAEFQRNARSPRARIRPYSS